MEILIPEAFKELFEPKRFKIYYGGRGGAKSHNIARALLIKAMQSKIRVLCVRELQKSISDSVHKLLADLIYEYKLDDFFTVQKAAIIGINGSEFFFNSLRYNANDIKSTEGVDICWVEEAESVSNGSWEMLLPTIRKPDSEIWVTFNPKSFNDPTYQRFVVNCNPERTILRKVSWRDNPFFPNVLNDERIQCQNQDLEAYNHIWEGEPDTRKTGYIYANLIDRAIAANRITKVPHVVGSEVITAWDLGKTHGTCIWFAQIVAQEVRVIDYLQAFGNDSDIENISREVKARDYNYSMHYLPHDGKHERMGMKGSISEQLKLAGIRNKILPSLSEKAGIEKGKLLLRKAFIDKDKTKDGIHAMSNFHCKFDEQRGTFTDSPYDDWSKDASDAWRYLAIALDNNVDMVARQHQAVTRPQQWSPF
jgi:phage terminase large subunit